MGGYPMMPGAFPNPMMPGPFGAYPPPPAGIPPYFNSMLEQAKKENERLNSELENIRTDPAGFDSVAKRAEDDIDKLKNTLLPQGLGKDPQLISYFRRSC